MSMPTMHRATLAMLAAPLLAGCFSYIPVEVETVSPGAEVRMELTRVGFAELPELPSYTGPDLGGTFVREGEGALWVQVPVAVRQDGLVARTIDRQVAVPADQVVWIRRRKLDKARTWLSAASGVTVLALIASGFRHDGNDTPELATESLEPEAGVTFQALMALFRE